SRVMRVARPIRFPQCGSCRSRRAEVAARSVEAARIAVRHSRLHTSRAMSVATTRGSADDDADEALMLAYAAGDASAFDRLYARHKGSLYRYMLRHCANAGVADELFQDVWMNVIRVRASYMPSARF